MVLKPAEATPLTAIETFRVFEDAGFPKGVVNLVTARDPAPVGEEFVTNPKIRKLTFTGSTAIGKMLAGRAAGNMKRVSCELGGHAPFIVLGDADPVHAAKGLQLVKFLNTGQACISPNRVYVHRDSADAFLDTLTGPGGEDEGGQRLRGRGDHRPAGQRGRRRQGRSPGRGRRGQGRVGALRRQEAHRERPRQGPFLRADRARIA